MAKQDLVIKGIQRKLLTDITFSSDEDLKAKRQIRVVAASGKADRVGDIVKIEGIEYVNYLKNPVILWAHDHYALPVGKAVAVENAKGKLTMTIQFATAEEYAFADTVYRMVLGGYLNGVSIGARVKEAEWMKDDEGNIVGRKFTSLELLELSVVPIPADSKALVTAVKSGNVSCEEFEECFTKTLEAPLDLPSENPVQVKTDEGALKSVEEESLMKEQIEQLEKRIAELEALVKTGAEQGADAKKMIDAMQMLFGNVMTQMAAKKVPDVASLTQGLPDGKGADVIKQAFSMLEAMQGKLNASR
jgi:HK97 family phage prohead protease